MEDIKKILKEYENNLRKLQNDRSDKTKLSDIYTKLKNLESKVLKEKESTERQERLMDIDELLFIVDSMMDYYCEEASEK